METRRAGEMLAERGADLVGATIRDIQERNSVYRDRDAEFIENVHEHVGQHHRLVCDVLRRGTPVEPDELDFMSRYTALRARQGVPLEAYLEAFRRYQGIVWSTLLELIPAISEAEALAAAGMVMRYLDHATTDAASTYVEVQQLLLANADRARRDLLDDLLAGRTPTAAAALAVARDAQLGPTGRCVVIVALPTDPLDDDARLRAAANELSRCLRGPGSPLVVVRQGEIVLVASVGPTGPSPFSEALEPACERIASTGLALAIGVSTVHDGIARVGCAYEEASFAARASVDSGGVLSLPDLSVFDYLMLRRDDVATRLVSTEIRAFIESDRDRGGALAQTVLAFAACGQNARAAADHLVIHVNTAHHRLGRIAEQTGRDPRDFGDLLELVIAIRLADLFREQFIFEWLDK